MPILLSLLLIVGIVGLHPAADDPDVTVRLLVPEEASKTLESSGIATLDEASSDLGWTEIEVPVDGSVEQTVESLSTALGQPVLVEQRYELLGPTDEPNFADQWYHHNTGQTNGTPDADIDSPTAWGRSLGAGVVVAVIDSGIDASHPDLSTQMWANTADPAGGGDGDGNGFVDDFRGWDFVDNDNNPSPVGSGASAAHGTEVAGLIAAASNGMGIVGVAPGAKVMAIRACDSGGCWSLKAAEAIYYAADNGADVINLSFGARSQGDPVIEKAIAHARSRNVVVVAAAGNEGRNLDKLGPDEQFIPAGLPLPNIVAVGATDDDDRLAGFSNFGPQSVDLVAPGVDVITTGAAGTSPLVFVSGTSFSSPIVAGAAAVLLSHDPGIGYQEVIARLEAFADRPAGISGSTGYGRLNIGRSIARRFVDTTGSVFEKSIDWLAEQNITQGCNPPFNHRYCPQNSVSRGEMAVFLSRAFHLPATSTNYFDDDNGSFYETAANRMAAAGLTVGCGPRRYCGGREIGRDEMAAMLARALHLPNSPKDFFVDDKGSVFENAINKIAAAGITLGCNPPTNNRYCPSDLVTRGQMAAFIKRAAE